MTDRHAAAEVPPEAARARIRALEAFVNELTGRLDEARRTLDERNRIDALTGLANRRAAMEWLEESWDEDRTGASPLSVLLVGVDGLSLVNEAFGYRAGDRALACIGRVLRHTVRTDDLAGRLAGDQFVLVLPNTPLDGAVQAGWKVSDAVSEEFVELDGGFWQASVSIGAATRREGLSTPSALVAAAARSLTEAKRRGHGLVVPAEPAPA